jgi:peptide/nickel transport system substrate-binding protein
MTDSDDRDPASRVLDDVASARLTRRSLLRRSAALGISAPVLGSLLAACQQPAPSGSATAAPSAGSSAAPARGGRIVVAMDAEPDFMNRLFTIRGGSIFAYAAMTDPMFDATSDGTYVPMLAADVPTVQNGMVSRDSLTVTYKLKPNLKWSDGKPLTTDDLEFTWKVYVDPESDATGRDPYRLIESLRKVDAQTVEVKMSKPNTDYLALWEILLPKHLYESTAVKRTHATARIPVGAGPFVLTDWKAGDQMTFERNPNYRDAGRPYLDGMTAKITPDRQVMLSAFIAGQFDYIHYLNAGDLATLEKARKDGKVQFVIDRTPTQPEWLWLNVSDNGVPGKPHPVLGDKIVRQAMDHAINKKAIIDQVLEGYAVEVGTQLHSGWAKVDIAPRAFDPQKANQMLDGAGWRRGADGVRTKDGVRASVRFTIGTDDPTRSLYQQLIQQNLKDVGIDVRIDNRPEPQIFALWNDGGMLTRGTFELAMSRYGGSLNPRNSLDRFTTALIPSATNPGGRTFSHWSNPAFDAAFAEADSTVDQEARKRAYERAARIWADETPAIPLYAQIRAAAFSNKLQGPALKFWRYESSALFDSENWSLRP